MHDHLWAGVDLRLHNARDTLDETRKVLQRPALGVQSIVQESAGAIIPGHDWQSKFYPLVTRFLAEVRAVPWIIEASFGEDRANAVMRAWWANDVTPSEQQRRSAFSAQFKLLRTAIDTHPLTTEESSEPLAALDDPELGGLLDRVDGVAASIGKSDDQGPFRPGLAS